MLKNATSPTERGEKGKLHYPKNIKKVATLGSEPPKRSQMKKDELDDLKDEESD